MSGGEGQNDRDSLAAVERLHAEVDRRVELLLSRLPGPLACGRGCADCCLDDLTVFPVEAHLIRARAADLLRTEAPGPAGGCAFLATDDSCRIYPWRPYVCRTQGLPLRWLATDADGADSEQRDICPLNEPPLGVSPSALAEDQCWTLGEFESRLAGLQAAATGFEVCYEVTEAVLRSLFGAHS